MFKKVLTASLILISSSAIAYTDVNYNTSRPIKGVYKGVYKAEVPVPSPSKPCLLYGPYLGLSFGPRINYTGAPAVYNGIEGDLVLGYFVMNPWGMLALELFGGDSAKVKNYNSPAGINIRSTWSGGISLLPGVMLAQNLIAYLRGGYVRTHFRANNPADPCHCSNGTNQNGWQVGLGGQSNIVDNLDVRGEYVYSQYKSISYIGRPRAQQFNLGIIYRFS